MFSREEAKQLREQFWIFFGKRYTRKWLRYHTGIKDVALKFDFDTEQASVALECTSIDEDNRHYYYNKLVSLKNIIREDVSEDVHFEQVHILKTGKEISRVFINKTQVNIHRRTDWPDVFEFFFNYMNKMETFFLEYKDFIKS